MAPNYINYITKVLFIQVFKNNNSDRLGKKKWACKDERKKWRYRGSNPRPLACKASALPLSYIPIAEHPTNNLTIYDVCARSARDAARCHSNVYPKKEGCVCSFSKLSTAHTLSLPTEKGSRRCESCKSSRVQTRKDGLWKLHGGRQPSTAACSRCRLEILKGRFCSHSACFCRLKLANKINTHTSAYTNLLLPASIILAGVSADNQTSSQDKQPKTPVER